MSRKEKSGYLYPTPVQPYPLRCITLHIPDEPKYREAFWGQVWQLARPWTWYQDAPVPSGQLEEVANYWLSLIWPDYQRYLAREDECEDMADCCPEPIIRFTTDGFTEISTDNGETWAANEGDPRFLPIPFLPRPESPGEAKRCNSAHSVRRLLEEATNTLIDTAGAWGAIQTLVDLILSVIAWVFPGLGTIASFFISIIVTALFFAGRTAFIAAMTPAVFDQFQCILYCQMDMNGQLSQVGWVQVKLDVFNNIPGIAGNWIWGWVSSLGPAGINASVGMFTGITADCSECECDECAVSLVDGQPGINLLSRPDLGIGWYQVTTTEITPPSPPDNWFATIDIVGCCLHNAYEVVAPGVNAAAGNREAVDCGGTSGFSNYGLGGCQQSIIFRSFGEATFQFQILPCPP